LIFRFRLKFEFGVASWSLEFEFNIANAHVHASLAHSTQTQHTKPSQHAALHIALRPPIPIALLHLKLHSSDFRLSKLATCTLHCTWTQNCMKLQLQNRAIHPKAVCVYKPELNDE
jgi:hypothetical protein